MMMMMTTMMMMIIIIACQLFANLGRKISSTSDDEREVAFLFQRVSVLGQCYNAEYIRLLLDFIYQFNFCYHYMFSNKLDYVICYYTMYVTASVLCDVVTGTCTVSK